MAGDEEARARAVLAEMQFRIAEGPTSTLGIGEIVTPEEVRTAFLALTKQYHPARFGRLSLEVQKLSNEVFLGIKSAHDHMLKALGSSTKASRGGRQAIPVAQHGADGSSRTSISRGSSSFPRVEGTSPPSRALSPGGGSTPTRSTPGMGVPVPTRAPTGAQPPTQRPAEPLKTKTLGPTPQPRQTGSIPLHRPGTPPTTSGTQPAKPHTPVPPTQPGVGVTFTASSPTPGGGTQPLSRPGTPGASPNPPPRPGTPPAAASQPVTRPITPVPPGTQPGVGATSANASQRMLRVRTPTGQTLSVPAGPQRTKQASSPPTSVVRPGDAMHPPPRPTPAIAPPTQRTPTAFTPPTQPPRPDNFNPPTVRNVPTPPGAPAASQQGGFDEAGAFRDATALMERKDWSAARQALHALAARVPQSKTYRAWLCYARGREAYIAGRPEDAILEMQRALQLEPDLAHAKHALTELQRRR